MFYGFSVYSSVRPQQGEDEIYSFVTLVEASRFARTMVTQTGEAFIIQSPKGTTKKIDLSHMGVS